jgi:hypothetical protein
MEITHALIAFVMEGDGEMDVLHFCGFDHQPLWDDRLSLNDRLNENPKYGLVGQTFQIMEAPVTMIKFYKELDPKDDDSYFVNEVGDVVKM